MLKLISFYQIRTKLISIYSQRKEGLEFLAYNIAGNFLTLALSFILPILLTGENYGIFVLIFSLYNVIGMLFTFGIDISIIKFTLDVEGESSSAILLTALLAWLILMIPFALILFTFAFVFYEFMSNSLSFSILSLVIFSALLISFQKIMLSYYIAKSEVGKYGFLFILNKLLQFCLFIGLFLLVSRDIPAIYYSILLIIQSIIVLGYIYYKEYYGKTLEKPTKQELKRFIYFSLPLSLNSLGTIGYGYGYMLLVSPLLSFSQLGVLNIFNQFGNIVSLVTNALNNGYIPTFYKEFRQNISKAVKKYIKYILYNSIIVSIGAFVGAILYKFWAFKENSDFSIFLLSLYIFAIFLYSFKSVGSNYWVLREKTLLITVFTIASSAINIAIGYYGSSQWGFVGCIIGLALGLILQVVMFNLRITIYLIKQQSR